MRKQRYGKARVGRDQINDGVAVVTWLQEVVYPDNPDERLSDLLLVPVFSKSEAMSWDTIADKLVERLIALELRMSEAVVDGSMTEDYMLAWGEIQWVLDQCGFRPLGDSRGWVQMDLWLAVLDESQSWQLSDVNKDFVKKVEGVYTYDANEVTRCCELTPSYCLYPIGSRAVSPEDTPDEVRGDIQDDIDGNDCHDVRYVHTHLIDTLPVVGDDDEVVSADYRRRWGSPVVSLRDTPYQQQIDDMVDYFRCNEQI